MGQALFCVLAVLRMHLVHDLSVIVFPRPQLVAHALNLQHMAPRFFHLLLLPLDSLLQTLQFFTVKSNQTHIKTSKHRNIETSKHRNIETSKHRTTVSTCIDRTCTCIDKVYVNYSKQHSKKNTQQQPPPVTACRCRSWSPTNTCRCTVPTAIPMQYNAIQCNTMQHPLQHPLQYPLQYPLQQYQLAASSYLRTRRASVTSVCRSTNVK
jgi:hypothetical protein